jgi:hypothetical protein
MEDKPKYGDTKNLEAPEEINKIILGELQEVFPYIKDVKLNIESEWVLKNPITRSSGWKTIKSILTIYADKSYEDEIKSEQSEFYDFENQKIKDGKDRELTRYIDKFYYPWKWILQYNLLPELRIESMFTNLNLDFDYI